MYILGISAFYHDSAACLLKDGKLIAAAQEERFTRKKNDDAFPLKAIEFCLAQASITAQQLDYVAFYEKPLIRFERLLITYLLTAPRGFFPFAKAMNSWLKVKLFIPHLIKKELKIKDVPIVFTEHHEAHAASAFFASPYKKAAILTVDGVGEWAAGSIGQGVNNNIKLLKEINFPHSLGLLYSAFTYYLGFRVNSAEYKVMGLAPYGKPKYVKLILNELVDLKGDGSFRLNMKYFDYLTGLRMTNSRFNKLFKGPRRKPEAHLTQRHKDIARSIQEVTEKIIMLMAKEAYKLTSANELCLAGGVALNCVATGKLLREGPFKKIWVQPAAGDAGGALGAAFFVWYQYLNNKRIISKDSDKQERSLLGPDYNEKEIKKYLDAKKIKYKKYDLQDELARKIALLLSQGKIVGFFQGKMEFGPRALGGRSILADPRLKEMKDILNRKIKFRESFRPFAPIVLEEKCSDYFDLSVKSPYMNMTVAVKVKNIPAVTHLDNSARLQTVAKEDNPYLYKVLQEFEKLTGCAVLINTSFNVRGEPIVCTPEDAYNCFLKTGIDHLVLENYLISK